MSVFSPETHAALCACPNCSAEHAHEEESGGYHYSFDRETGALITAQGLVMPGSAAGYVQALFGTDDSIWADGGAGTAAFGNAATVKYTFSNVTWENPYGWAGEQTFDSAQQAAALAAMQLWSNVANITFVQGTTSTAKLAFGEYDLPSGSGVTLTWSANDDGVGGYDRIQRTSVGVDVAVTDYAEGSYGKLTLVHELGHVLGLKHPGNYNTGGGSTPSPYLSDFGLVDSRDFTVMSYYNGTVTSGGNYPVTPMLYDIAAAQYLYGANTAYNSGNTTYALTSGNHPSTRWDGAGTDTLSASGYSGSAVIDLREGEAYVTQVGTSYSWNAFGANIENATGGSGNDAMYGNALANVLNGNSGNDVFYGGDGRDMINGGNGNDTLDGGAGPDLLTGGTGADVYRFSSLTDSVNTGGGHDRIYGFVSGEDILDLTGLGFIRLIASGSTLTGELRMSYSSTTDRTYVRSDQVDFEFFLQGDYRTILTDDDFLFDMPEGFEGSAEPEGFMGTQQDDVLNGYGGNDTLIGGGGDDTIDGGVGMDHLTGAEGADVFRFSSLTDSVRTAHDRIYDFVVGEDKVDLSGLGFTGLTTSVTEAGELRLSYSSTTDRTYVRSDQVDFEFFLMGGDYRQAMTEADFIFS